MSALPAPLTRTRVCACVSGGNKWVQHGWLPRSADQLRMTTPATNQKGGMLQPAPARENGCFKASCVSKNGADRQQHTQCCFTPANTTHNCNSTATRSNNRQEMTTASPGTSRCTSRHVRMPGLPHNNKTLNDEASKTLNDEADHNSDVIQLATPRTKQATQKGGLLRHRAVVVMSKNNKQQTRQQTRQQKKQQ